ncbi:hypothetical protein M2222_001090 [Bradyrhizobium elkanii]|uniref:hypothetical protein n=1 Tax=Bradyrhizobium elkanii TaxID=29448 RepID=UPI002166F9B4|nr:hypothetical protein [Bradyrhizobium elkanii]MCS3450087.1 hypothetical protein [Bradyrhizobium elkanii]MCS3558768.1 hypothetical protein [Bradyrhizobium elkanii]MCW2151384.1 hypothetical protein [Bradyrhizobium elkanii]MCW2375115.1 hypothetical protein [Bradyrhizobium elkanii]
MDERSKPFEAIVGEKLSAITFVLDYWQLQFDGPSINALTRLSAPTEWSYAIGMTSSEISSVVK